MEEFSHVEDGRASMVDVSDKPAVRREAAAAGEIRLDPETVRAIEGGETAKGDVLATARIAAIQAVKRTWDDVPMCHQIPISDVDVEFSIGEERLTARVSVTSTGKTGVEMEAVNGVTRALVTVWDMVKSAEKDPDGQYPTTRIEDVRIERKVKGAAGERD